MAEVVTLNNGKTFNTESEQTLLEAAAAAELVLEHSCRTGRCGVCKVKVIAGSTNVIKNQEALTEQEIKEGYILTCCRAAETAVELDTEDLGELGKLKVKTIPCRIDQLTKLSHDVIEVVLRTPPASRLEYLPGQYIDVIGKEGLRRSYSVANAPKASGKITLQIRKVENGVMSHYWFNEAQANDLLRLEGPLGTFCLRKANVKNLVLLATGTGIAPIKAILEQLEINPELQTFSDIYLYWGGRYTDDLYWQPEFPKLPLHFVPVLSRSTDWQGRKGYIQTAVTEDGINLNNAVVYACGSEAMINSAKHHLMVAGLPAKNFYSDAFVSSN